MNSARVATVDAGRIIKVNHAGEHGAVNIYAGQIAAARLRARVLLSELAEILVRLIPVPSPLSPLY